MSGPGRFLDFDYNPGYFERLSEILTFDISLPGASIEIDCWLARVLTARCAASVPCTST